MAAPSSGALGFGQFAVRELGLGGIGSGADAFDFCAVSAVDRIKGGAADGDDLDRVGALYRGQCIAGVDRADEGIGRFNAGDFRDLRDIKQRSNTW